MKHVITILVAFTINVQLAAQNKIYWTEGGIAPRIRSANLTGTSAKTILDSGMVNPYGLAIDQQNGKLYWCDADAGKIQCCDTNGSNVLDLVTNLLQPYAIALDVSSGKMYWTDRGSNKIQRSNLDGSSVEDVIPGIYEPLGLDIDTISQKIYWVERSTNKIFRADVNGQNKETVMEEVPNYACETPDDVFLDQFYGVILWSEMKKLFKYTDYGTGNVIKISQYEITNIFRPHFISLDLVHNKVYATDSLAQQIHWISLDGNYYENITPFIGGVFRPHGIALTVDGHVGAFPLQDRLIFTLHPNPSTGRFTVEWTGSGIGELSIRNLFGQEVYRDRIPAGSTAIDLGRQAAGMYFLSLRARGDSCLRKLLVR